MQAIDRLVDDVNTTMAGDPWYGSSVLRIVGDIDASQAASRSIPHAHSIWELVLHMTAWTREATRRLRGAPAGDPAEGDWPAVAGTDGAAWSSAITSLRSAHEELAQTLASLDDAELSRQVGGSQVDAAGRPVTFYRTVIGLLQHDAYHAGQIALIKKMGHHGV